MNRIAVRDYGMPLYIMTRLWECNLEVPGKPVVTIDR